MSGELASALCPRCLAFALHDDDMEEYAAPPVRVGPWLLISQLGSGGTGVVWRARRERPAREVALKVLRGAFLPGESAVRRLRQEAELIARLRHPGIVTLYEMGEAEGCAWLAMELMEGGSLAERIRAARPSAREAADIMAKVARAVHHAHERGVLHRDLKPHNILLEPDNTAQPRVTDFGLARLEDSDSSLTKSGDLFGTPAYMAPERARGGSSNSSVATDVYGLGATLYELLTGVPPFTAPAPVELLRRVVDEEPAVPAGPGVDQDLATVCLHALEKAPARRYASALAFAEDLERWLRHEPVVARRSSPLRRLAKWCRRRPAAAALVAVLILTSSAAVWLTLYYPSPLQPGERPLTAEERRERSRGQMQSALRLMKEDDPCKALPYLYEAIIEGTGDEARDHVNRVRFEALARFTPRLERIFFPEEAEGLHMQFSSDGKAVLILTARRARVHDLESGAAMGPDITPAARIKGGELSSDGSRLVLSLDDGRWGLWDPRDGKFVAGGEGSVRCAPPQFSLQPCVFRGDRFVAARGNTVQQWRAEDGVPVSPPVHFTNEVWWAVYLTGAPRLGVLTGDDYFRVIDEKTGAAVGEPLRSCDARTHLLRYRAAPETTIWLRSGSDEVMHVDPPTGKLFGGSYVNEPVYALGWVESTQRAVMLTASAGGLNCQESIPIVRMAQLELGAAGISGDFSARGELAAGLAGNGCARFFDPAKAVAASPGLYTTGAPLGIGLSTDGRTAAVRTALPAVWIWKLRDHDGAEAEIRTEAAPGTVQFSEDSSQIIADGGTARAWNVATGRAVPPGAAVPATDPALHPDKTRVLSWGAVSERYAVVRILSVPDHQEAAVPLTHNVILNQAIYSPDGRYIGARDIQTGVQIWDAVKHRALSEPRQHPATVEHLAFSPDGRMYSTVWGQNSARVWETLTGDPVTPVLRHSGAVRALWSPDGRTLLTCADGNVRVWPLGVSPGDAAALRMVAGALSSHRIASDRAGSLTPLTREELRAAREAFEQAERAQR